MAYVALALTAAAAAESAPRAARDPVAGMVDRLDRYFARHDDAAGVVIDPRIAINAPEAIRLSVIPQLLGYAELRRIHPEGRWRRHLVACADYLLAHDAEARSGTVFDGMLGYAFLEAYEATGDPRYAAQARVVLDQLEAQPRHEYVLNGGLMAALAFARSARLSGDTAAGTLAHEILANLPNFQNDDGSFPHWCSGSEDVHYTGWMAMELILIGRQIDDPVIEPTLRRMNAFLERRIDDQGVTHYQAPCPWDPAGCIQFFYSQGTGCSVDYDTRGFPNEPAYTALLFDHEGSPKYPAVVSFLASLEDGGTFPDKWDYFIPPSDPYYPWTTADTSIVNMSVIFWALTALESGRAGARHPAALAGPAATGEHAPALGTDAATGASPTPLAFTAVPNPTRGACRLRLAAAGTDGTVPLVVYDVRGRRVRGLDARGAPGDGTVEALWDGRDDAGAACPGGLYFVRVLRAGAARGAAPAATAAAVGKAGVEDPACRVLLLR